MIFLASIINIIIRVEVTSQGTVLILLNDYNIVNDGKLSSSWVWDMIKPVECGYERADIPMLAVLQVFQKNF